LCGVSLVYRLGELADCERHAAFDMLAAFRRELELETRKDLFDQKPRIAVFGEFNKSVDCLRSDLRLAVTEESDIEW